MRSELVAVVRVKLPGANSQDKLSYVNQGALDFRLSKEVSRFIRSHGLPIQLVVFCMHAVATERRSYLVELVANQSMLLVEGCVVQQFSLQCRRGLHRHAAENLLCSWVTIPYTSHRRRSNIFRDEFYPARVQSTPRHGTGRFPPTHDRDRPGFRH